MQPPRRILPVIVFSQFAGTSLWFAGNAIIGALASREQFPADVIASISTAVQFGFIFGTLLFAALTIPDRFSPRKLFLFCAVAGALCNVSILAVSSSQAGLIAGRFLTGLFLAGIYPVGMKIAAGWFQADLGKAIGLLVGALVVGSAFPFFLQGLGETLPWQWITVAVTVLAIAGGLAMYLLVPDGPFLSRGGRFDPRALAVIFRSRGFRASAFGYFGHMWELYAFWVYLPVFLAAHLSLAGSWSLNAPLWVFWIIAAGAFGSVAGGYMSARIGSARVAVAQLRVSGICCALSPFFYFSPTPVFLAFLLVWGITVVGDSPQFSALNARTAPPGLVGSALTIANCVGFTVSIVSIVLLGILTRFLAPHLLFLVLLCGPVFGLLAMRPLLGRTLEPVDRDAIQQRVAKK